jgi:hypothetical protein
MLLPVLQVIYCTLSNCHMPTFPYVQCCNAKLWVWSPKPVNTSIVDPYIPAAHRHRIVYKHLDVYAEWAGIAADFPGINATLVDKMLLFMDIRYVSDFIRQVRAAAAAARGWWCSSCSRMARLYSFPPLPLLVLPRS